MENIEKLKLFNELLTEQNKVVNLTGHKDPEKSWHYNIQDSLLFNGIIAKLTEPGWRVLDIGSGGGCPAIPLKLTVMAQADVFMLDSVGKKVRFLNNAVQNLGLENVRAIHDRAEDYAKKARESFDIVTARAVAPLNTLLEYALPFLRVGGVFLAFKSSNPSEEIVQAQIALEELGGVVESIERASLDNEITRTLVVIRKVKATAPKYPRGRNLPRLEPL